MASSMNKGQIIATLKILRTGLYDSTSNTKTLGQPAVTFSYNFKIHELPEVFVKLTKIDVHFICNVDTGYKWHAVLVEVTNADLEKAKMKKLVRDDSEGENTFYRKFFKI